jgi:lysozyme
MDRTVVDLLGHDGAPGAVLRMAWADRRISLEAPVSGRMAPVNLIEQLRRDEGVRTTVYLDSVGIPTIGVGRNLRDVGLSDSEVDFLLANDIQRAEDGLSGFAWYQGLDEVRKAAVTNMAFNLGVSGLLHFPHFIAALAKQDWTTAAAEMANSAWAGQVGARAKRLEQQILTGEWQ